jgi:hypothetical protein
MAGDELTYFGEVVGLLRLIKYSEFLLLIKASTWR